jgi:hypothetical protein
VLAPEVAAELIIAAVKGASLSPAVARDALDHLYRLLTYTGLSRNRHSRRDQHARRHDHRGGVGGLCLAQGLRQAGVPARVYERDQAPDARLQDYRLNIEPIGSGALHDCLPSQLWRLLVATAGDPGPGMGVFTHRMKPADARAGPDTG